MGQRLDAHSLEEAVEAALAEGNRVESVEAEPRGATSPCALPAPCAPRPGLRIPPVLVAPSRGALALSHVPCAP